MRAITVAVLVLLGSSGDFAAVQAAPVNSCKQCRDQQRACTANYAGPICKTDFDRCMKSCRRK